MSIAETNQIDDIESDKLFYTTQKYLDTNSPYNSTIVKIINNIKNGITNDANVINPYIDELTASNDIQQWNLGLRLWALTHQKQMTNRYERLPNSFMSIRDTNTGEYYHMSSIFKPDKDFNIYWAPKRSRAVAQHYHFPQYRIYKDYYSNSPIAQLFSKGNEWLDNHGKYRFLASTLPTGIAAAAGYAELIPGPHQQAAYIVRRIAEPLAIAGTALATGKNIEDGYVSNEVSALRDSTQYYLEKANTEMRKANKSTWVEDEQYHNRRAALALYKAEEKNRTLSTTIGKGKIFAAANLINTIRNTFSKNEPIQKTVNSAIPQSTIKHAPISGGGGGGSSFKQFYSNRRTRNHILRRRNYNYLNARRRSRRYRRRKNRHYYYYPRYII